MAMLTPLMSTARPLAQSHCVEATGPFPKFTGLGGAWTSNGTELLLLDNFEQVVLRYDSAGRSKGPILTSLAKHVQGGRPRSITTIDGQSFYMQTDANRFALVDDRYSYRPVVAKKSSSDDLVGKVYIHSLTQEDVVAFADVQSTGGLKKTWSPGFIWFPKENPESFRWIHKGVSYNEKLWYQLALPYVAGLGNTAYILRMTSPYALYQFNPAINQELEKLSALDPTPASRAQNLLPQLSTLNGPDDFNIIMKEIEHAQDLPVGLYGYGRRLYLLMRTWKGNHTEWSLKVLDPESDRLLGTVKLSVDAEHLSLVPGPSTWAIIRKSHPEGIRRQDVTGITLFNGTALLRGDTLPASICSQ